MDDERIIAAIIERHGEVIDVRQRPEVILDIIRRYAPAYDDGGLPGGVPPSPPGPTSIAGGGGRPEEVGGPTMADVMKEVLNLSRSMDELKRQVGGG